MDVTSSEAPEQPATTMPEVPADRDVSNIDPSAYPARDLPRLRDERQGGFQAVLTRSALNDMHRHGRSSPDVEVCGVLVGNVYHDDRGPYLYVEASIKGDHAAGKTAQVTFTAETWNHINDEMEKNHAGKKILGWYHTHPGFGIFLSEMDLFIQNNFFPEPWQVAYVYDPKSGEDGTFVWKRGQATRDPHLIDPDTINTDPPAPKGADVPTTGTLAELTARVQSLEHKLKVILVLLVIVAALAVVSPLLAHLLLPAMTAEPAPPGAMPTTMESSIDRAIPASLRLPPPTTTANSPWDTLVPAPPSSQPTTTQPDATPAP
jgi:proteasome lid subunit RPN8/RPN11